MNSRHRISISRARVLVILIDTLLTFLALRADPRAFWRLYTMKTDDNKTWE